MRCLGPCPSDLGHAVALSKVTVMLTKSRKESRRDRSLNPSVVPISFDNFDESAASRCILYARISIATSSLIVADKISMNIDFLS